MRGVLALVAALTLAAAPLLAQAAKPAQAVQGGWRFEARGRHGLATATSADGTGLLRMICDSAAPIDEEPPALNIENLIGWAEGGALAVTIDGQPWPVEVDRGGPDYAALRHRPDRPGYGGVDLSLIAALRDGAMLELDGPAAAGMAPAARRYPLAGARDALTAWIAHCRY